MLRVVVLFHILVCFSSCFEKPKPKRPGQEEAKADGVSKSYTKDGKLIKEIALQGGKRNGLSKTYFSNGKVSMSIFYKDDQKEGMTTRYYESGKVYQETPYAKNKIHGVQKKYRDDGQLMSEAVYNQGEPCKGLQEYLLDGQLVSDYPKIQVKPLNELATAGRYTLRISLSDKGRRVKYFKGKLSKEGCMPDYAMPIPIRDKNGIGELIYRLPPGGFLMEEIDIIAQVHTRLGNQLILQTHYQLAVDN